MESAMLRVLCLLLYCVHCHSSIAIPCNHTVECGGVPGTQCVADFCQPSPCTEDNQCVQQQICSHEHHTGRQCVYSIDLKAKEGECFTLKFSPEHSNPASSFEEIRWYKGDLATSIVFYQPSVTGGVPKYFGGYCAQSCNSSQRVSLDVITGDLTIHEVHITDEDYYFYRYSVTGDHEDGSKYEIKMEVTGGGGDVAMYVASVVGVVVVLAVLICCIILVIRYRKMRKRLQPIYRQKVPQQEN